MAAVSVRLPDGTTKELEPGTTALGLAEAIGPRLAKAAVAATVDGEGAERVSERIMTLLAAQSPRERM